MLFRGKGVHRNFTLSSSFLTWPLSNSMLEADIVKQYFQLTVAEKT